MSNRVLPTPYQSSLWGEYSHSRRTVLVRFCEVHNMQQFSYLETHQGLGYPLPYSGSIYRFP
jgi:hypothetical protein